VIESIAGFAYDCKNADVLADFYVKLLGWKKELSGEGWAGLRSPQGWILAFQEVDEYVPPEWPWKDGKQQQMAHIDFLVNNLKESVDHALQCGARKSEIQYFDTSIVMFDPEGHPFCLSTEKQ
jgi:catechol 2,3-dioxygenase-like lactoylglutathione lyase family enzyme